MWKPLLHAAQRVEGRLEAELAGAGLSLSKLGVLTVLVESEEPLPLSRLADKLACVKSNVTQLVDRLEAEALVRRAADPSDRRSVLAEITPEGRSRQAAGSAIVARVEREVFEVLSDEQREALARLLDALGAEGCAEAHA